MSNLTSVEVRESAFFRHFMRMKYKFVDLVVKFSFTRTFATLSMNYSQN